MRKRRSLMDILSSMLPLMICFLIIGAAAVIVYYVIKITRSDLMGNNNNNENSKALTLEFLEKDLTVCKVEKGSSIDYTDGLCFIGNTDEELSLVCETEKAPENTIEREDGWRVFRIIGILDFSLTGILSKIAKVLADRKIGIFAVSTYNTDYILVKEENFELALNVLEAEGYSVV
jgi:hypothetical protein